MTEDRLVITNEQIRKYREERHKLFETDPERYWQERLDFQKNSKLLKWAKEHSL